MERTAQSALCATPSISTVGTRDMMKSRSYTRKPTVPTHKGVEGSSSQINVNEWLRGVSGAADFAYEGWPALKNQGPRTLPET